MFVRVRVIVGERQDALLVPEEAIVPQGEEFFVYKVVEGAAQRVPVKIGVRRDAKVEIVQGLAPGDQVVTAGMRLSRDGQPVRVLSPGQGVRRQGDAGQGGGAEARSATASLRAEVRRRPARSDSSSQETDRDEPVRTVHPPPGPLDGAVAAGARHRPDFVFASRGARVPEDRRAGGQRADDAIPALRPRSSSRRSRRCSRTRSRASRASSC